MFVTERKYDKLRKEFDDYKTESVIRYQALKNKYEKSCTYSLGYTVSILDAKTLETVDKFSKVEYAIARAKQLVKQNPGAVYIIFAPVKYIRADIPIIEEEVEWNEKKD